MGLTNHLSCLSDAFSFYSVYFPLMTIMTMTILGPRHMVSSLFHFSLQIPLLVSVEYFPSVVSVKYIPMVVSVEKFPLVVSVENFPLVVSVEYFPLAVSVENIKS